MMTIYQTGVSHMSMMSRHMHKHLISAGPYTHESSYVDLVVYTVFTSERFTCLLHDVGT